MSDETKAAVEQLNEAWAEFKANNDAKIAAEAKGAADVLFEAKAATLNAALDNLGAQVKALETKMARPSAGEAEDERSSEFKSAVRGWLATGHIGDSPMEQKALTIGTPADGGYALPKVIDAEVEKLAVNISPLRALAKVVSISTNDYRKLVSIGGTTSGWVAETGTRTATNTPQLAEVAIPPYELYANAQATVPILEDPAFNMEQWLLDEIYEEFFRAEGAAFVSGDGSNKPTGILNGTPVTTADGARAFGVLQYTASGQAAAMPTSLDTLITLQQSLKQAYRTGAAWLTNKAVVGALRTYKTTTNDYLWQPSVQAGVPATFMGYPVYEGEDMPAVGAGAFPLAFGNFQRGYQITDRQDVRLIRDPYSNKPYIGFYCVKRVGGKVVNSEAIKLLKIAAS